MRTFLPSIRSILLTTSLMSTLGGFLVPPVSSLQLHAESKAERDARMRWWREARFGMFIHWGVYSIPARGEWVMFNEKIPVAEYEKFPPQFNPVKFDARAWVRIAKSAGVRYIVITSKHHDGFCMWDSKVSTYDIMDATPFKRDVLKELAAACRREGIRLCFYYSIMDWHHPDARGDRFPLYRDAYMKPQLKELIRNYGPLGVLWFDGQWIAEWDEEQGRQLYDELHALQPDLIMNNRIGKGRNESLGEPGGAAMVGDFGTPEQYIPGEGISEADWESCMTMNDHWGYAAKDTNWKSPKVLVQNLVDIASKGGNYLLNVGPTSEGEIPQESVERLERMGRWLSMNGEAIYGTQASPFDATPWGRCTMKHLAGTRTRLYLHVFEWPRDGRLAIPGLGSKPHSATLLGSRAGYLPVELAHDTVVIALPPKMPDTLGSVVRLEFTATPLIYRKPIIIAPVPVFVTDVKAELRVSSPQLEIRYTLDGTEPTAASQRYEGLLTLSSSAELKARAFQKGKAVSETVEKTFTKAIPRAPVTVEGAVPGLAYEYFEGEWTNLPDFDTLRAVAKGTAATIGTQMRQKEEKYGLRLTGFLSVPEDGVYRLSLNSDDGSRLLIGGDAVIDNDGLHSPLEKQTFVALAKGAHPITILYFNALWEGTLGVGLAREGAPPQPIPAQLLTHKP